MKIGKKLLMIILSALASLATLFGLISCNKEKKNINLIGFTDATVEASLYEDFSVSSYLMAVDEAGNTYKGTADVTDHEGNPVALTFNRFELTSLESYTIKIAVTVKEKDVRTRTITINVKDNSQPKFIYSSSLNTGIVGASYLLPSVTATKKTGEPLIATLKVYYDNNGSWEEQTITDGQFIPQKAGNYRLEAAVTDVYGESFVKNKNIVIRPPMEDGVLEDFDHESSYENITAGGSLRFTAGYTAGRYQKSYTDGSNVTANGVGVGSMHYANGCMALRFAKTENELKEIMQTLGSLTVRLLITRDGVDELAFSVLGVKKTIPVNTWYDFTVPRSAILAKVTGATEAEKIANFAANFCSTGNADAPQIFAAQIASSKTSLPVYVDSVTYAVSTENVLEGFNVESTKLYIPKLGNSGFTAGEPATVGGEYYTSKKDAVGTTEYGVIMGKMYSKNDCTTLRLGKTESELVQALQTLGSLTVRLMVDKTDVTELEFKVLGVNKTIPTNTWYDFTITRDELFETVRGKNIGGTPIDTQDKVIAQLAKNFCSTGSGKAPYMFSATIDANLPIYVDKVTYTSLNFLEGFDTSDSKQYLTENTSFEQGYTSTAYSNTGIAGAVGVAYAKMLKGNQCMALRFGKTETELTEIMQDLETLTVRVYVRGTTSATTTVNFKVFGVQKTLNVTTWYEITVTRDQILAKMSGETEAEKIASFASNYCNTGNADSWILSASGLTESIYVYVDRVTYTVANA